MNDQQISAIQQQLNELRQALAAARETLRAANVEILETAAAPPTREQAQAAFETALAQGHERVKPRLTAHIQRWISQDPSLRDREIYEVGGLIRQLLEANDESLLMAILWPAIAREVADAISAMPWPQNAMEPAAKEKRLAALEPQRQAAQRALNALEKQAAQLGIA